MSEVISPPSSPVVPATHKPAPRVGFVSLGCPKALTDSELILTQLSAEGYQTSKTFEGADLVIVNTCGFIDDAVKESLDTIGEALAANGRVIVTGCLGAKAGEDGGNMVRQMHRVHDFLRCMRACHSQYAGVHLPHHITAILARFGAQAARHDHPSISS